MKSDKVDMQYLRMCNAQVRCSTPRRRRIVGVDDVAGHGLAMIDGNGEALKRWA